MRDDDSVNDTTTCAIVGGGPAGMVLGLLLARAGIEVTVLEKHADFLRDFRGDTVHPTTLRLIDDLGLWPRFADISHSRLDHATVDVGAGKSVTMVDFRRLRQPHPYIAMVPQWDLLNLLGAPLVTAADFGADRDSPGLHGRPTAAELLEAVADFLDHDVRDATTGQVNFHTRVAANALRMVQRELTATGAEAVHAAIADLGAADEAALAASIRRGDFDERADDLLPALRHLVGHRLAAAHPGYEQE